MSGSELTMLRRGEGFVPAASMFLEDVLAIPEGKPIIVDWRFEDDESDLQRRWLFFVLGELIKGGSWDGDKESLLEHLKIEVKHYRPLMGGPQFGTEVSDLAERILAGGGFTFDDVRKLAQAIKDAGPRVYLVPRSIARSAIRPDHFRRFLARVEDYINTVMGVDVSEFRKRPDYLVAPAVRKDRTTEEQPIDGALRAELTRELAILAHELQSEESLADMEALWKERWTDGVVKELRLAVPDILKAIVEAARNFHRGKLDDERFQNVVKIALEQVEKQREAA